MCRGALLTRVRAQAAGVSRMLGTAMLALIWASPLIVLEIESADLRTIEATTHAGVATPRRTSVHTRSVTTAGCRASRAQRNASTTPFRSPAVDRTMTQRTTDLHASAATARRAIAPRSNTSRHSRASTPEDRGRAVAFSTDLALATVPEGFFTRCQNSCMGGTR